MTSSTTGVGRNSAGRMYGLTALFPIIIGISPGENRSHTSALSQLLAELPQHDRSPFAHVPDTYFARFWILRDVFYESRPAREEHLKSQYLVFTTNFHGRPRPYLWEMWSRVGERLRPLLDHCVAFSAVTSAEDFVRYVLRCQVDNALLFNGSTDQPLAEQLKGLYLKQHFGDFAATHQGLPATELQAAFVAFLADAQPDNLRRPTWRPGADSLASVEVP